MSENNSLEASPIMSAHENITDTESETRILAQEAVVEQIGNYIAPLTRQLDDLTWLMQGMSTTD